MQYTFVKTQLKHCPSVTGWYLKLGKDNMALLAEMHLLVTQMQLLKYKKDPHIPDGLRRGELLPIYNPIIYGNTWVETIQKHKENWDYLLVNHAGGWMPLDKQVKIIQEITSDEMEFPVDRVENDVYVTITRWPNAKHYYLQSNKNHVFPKCNTLNGAMREAKRFALDEHIKVKEHTDQSLSPEL